VAGLLVAVFIYWGWDSTVCVNEETTDSGSTPGKAAIASTVILVGIYVLVAAAAVAFAGPDTIANDESGDALGLLGAEVLGTPWDKIVVIAVLTSAAASTQTTILPTARTSLSMARAKAMPERLGEIHPRYLTPHVSTILMGVFSILWYVGLTIVSENILYDSIAALGLMIAFYYGLTGFACAWYYRHELTKSVKAFLLVGVAPLLGGIILTYVLVRSAWDLSKPENSESGDSWLGVGPPLVIGVGLMLFGVVLMLIWYSQGHREFFRRKPEVADPGSLEAPPPPPPARPAETAGVA
jgi:amino acid transporter